MTLLRRQIVALYIAIVVELLGTRIQDTRASRIKARTAAVGDRYGALTLIILGEGLISITRAFSLTDADFEKPGLATGTGALLYAAIMSGILIIVITFLYLFGTFKGEETVTFTRTFLWEAIHFPLHFCILLVLASIVVSIAVWLIGPY